jgi:hypothetical protein
MPKSRSGAIGFFGNFVVLLPTLLLALGIAAATYIARNAIVEDIQPPHYRFVLDLIAAAAGVVMEVVLVVLGIEHLRERSKENYHNHIVSAAKKYAEEIYNHGIQPVLCSIRDFLELEDEFARSEASGATEEEGHDGLLPYMQTKFTECLGSLKVAQTSLRDSRYLDRFDTLIGLVGGEDALDLLAVRSAGDRMLAFTPNPNSSLIVNVSGTKEYKCLYPQFLSLAAWIALPIRRFEEVFHLSFVMKETFADAGIAIEMAEAKYPFSRLLLPDTSVRDDQQSRYSIVSGFGDVFLNKMQAWWRNHGSYELIRHGLGGDTFQHVLDASVAAQTRTARKYKR